MWRMAEGFAAAHLVPRRPLLGAQRLIESEAALGAEEGVRKVPRGEGAGRHRVLELSCGLRPCKDSGTAWILDRSRMQKQAHTDARVRK